MNSRPSRSLSYCRLFAVLAWMILSRFDADASTWGGRRPSLSITPNSVNIPTPNTAFFKNNHRLPMLLSTRGGGESNARDEDASQDDPSLLDDNNVSTETQVAAADDDEEEDAERYSRQVYTLGARAHGLIRSSTVYLEGPTYSGLLYEAAKNLALSGVRNLVVVVPDATSPADASDDDNDTHGADHLYHDSRRDDLGRAYDRAATAELGVGSVETIQSPHQVMKEYLRRLNPNIAVSSLSRSQLAQQGAMTLVSDQERAVLLAVDRPATSQVQLNDLAREKGWAFVSSETAGVYGRLFADFGDDFQVMDADGEAPLQTPLDHMESLDTDSDDLMVYCVEGEKHDVSKGDVIEFQLRDGSLASGHCKVLEVHTPFRFRVQLVGTDNKATFVLDLNENAASFRRRKIPQSLAFKPLRTALDRKAQDVSLFTPCDLDKSWDNERRESVMACFKALETFVSKNERLPTSADLDEFAGLVGGMGESKHARNFLGCCAARFTPLQAVFGAISAQEVLKAITGLYSPIHQFLLYDCDEILEGVDVRTEPSQACRPESPDSGLRYILGDKLIDHLQNQRVFVVGAGAIGCELLKNLAPMGVGSGKKGKIILTDMDSIEKSNLSRQLLFRDGDIGKFKSVAAKESAKRFNSAMKIESYSAKVGGNEQSPFDDGFWGKKVHIVLNALDNMDARLFMDAQCVANEKALVDAGTMGPKGNVQVVIPHQSESYASSADPPEQSIPVCTLKNFPYAISHTIQWSRDLFENAFVRRPEQANDVLDSLVSTSPEQLASKLLSDAGEESAVEKALEIREDLGDAEALDSHTVESHRSQALKWAMEMAVQLYYTSAKQLLEKHPRDSVDEDGEPFWSGTRRPPHIIVYSQSQDANSQQASINENLELFVQNAARLRLESFKESNGVTFSIAEVKDVLQTWPKEARREEILDRDVGDIVREAFRELSRETTARLQPAEFEKDDDTNGHIAFVTAASNLRAISYGIPPASYMETRKVAGNIIPAMITTTAYVAGLSCIELVKVAQKAPLTAYRNAFINLALPFFAFTVPMPAEEVPGLNGRSYTLWDRLVVKEGKKAAAGGGLKLRSLLRRIKKLASDDPDSVDVPSISYGPFLLYANFLHEDDDDVLDSSVWDLVEEAVSSEVDFDREFSRSSGMEETEGKTSVQLETLLLTVIVEDTETGLEVELPPVKVNRYRNKD